MFKTTAMMIVTSALIATSQGAIAAGRSPLDAYGALTPFDTAATARHSSGANGGRAAAMRSCSDAARGFKQTTWGVTQGQMYRSCMARFGQAE
jgi:hypothetical protein